MGVSFVDCEGEDLSSRTGRQFYLGKRTNKIEHEGTGTGARIFFVTRKFNLKIMQILLHHLETSTVWIFTYCSFNILRSNLKHKIC